jgi:hypothetical protein
MVYRSVMMLAPMMAATVALVAGNPPIVEGLTPGVVKE